MVNMITASKLNSKPINPPLLILIAGGTLTGKSTLA